MYKYMNLRFFTRLIACCLVSLPFFSSCNSDSTYDVGELSSDGQITNFKITSIATNAIDSVTYPAMKTTKFTIVNDGQYLIFNTDSLPQHTEIRTLMVNLSYSSTPSRIDLVYKDKNGADSIPEDSWNGADSVKFFKEGNSGRYLPDFKVIAPNGTERRYSVTLNIHTTDPDSIRWTRVENASAQYFDLMKNGENKTVINVDSTLFYSLTNDGSKVYLYSSDIVDATREWKNLKETNLSPNNVVVDNFCLVDGYFVVTGKDGKVYTIAESGNWAQWTENTTNHIVSVLGSFADQQNAGQSNLLLVVKKADGTFVFAKAKAGDINSVTELTLTASTSSLVPSGFPVTGFSTIPGSILPGLDDQYIVITGGTNADGSVVNRSWMVKDVSADEIQVVDGYKEDLLEYKFGVTTFAYNKKMYMLANDSIYTSIGYGNNWAKVGVKQSLKEEMIIDGMDKPSIIVDKDNFVWIFGGKYKGDVTRYSKRVWRGRLNQLTHKRFN